MDVVLKVGLDGYGLLSTIWCHNDVFPANGQWKGSLARVLEGRLVNTVWCYYFHFRQWKSLREHLL